LPGNDPAGLRTTPGETVLGVMMSSPDVPVKVAIV
jgi:hypothetical protein